MKRFLCLLACISLTGCTTTDEKREPPMVRSCTCPAYPTNFPPVIYAP
jgi:hypothetical protein